MAIKKLKIDLIPALKKLQIKSKGIMGTGKFIGSYKSGFRGKGLEFADYRPYNQEDDAMLIDWKASLRSDKILIKEYVEERNLDVFILFDVSDSMLFGSQQKLKNEYAAELIASLAHAVIESGDNIGFALFNDKIIKEFPIERGLHQYYTLSKTLVNPNFYGGQFDFDNVATYILNKVKKDSILIIVSDFIGLKPTWVKKFEYLAQRFKVIGVMVRDPRDRELPDMGGQQVVVEDPYSGEQLTVDSDLLKYAYQAEVRDQEKKIQEIFVRNNSAFLNLDTGKDFAKPLMTFFKSLGGRRH